MGSIIESEAFVKLFELFDQYKRFCFSIISKVPYASVPAWIAFSDGRMEDAFRERRGIWQSIKDTYAIYVLGAVFLLIAFWWMALLFGLVLLVILSGMLAAGLFANPPAMALALAVALAAVAIGSAVFTLLRAAFYHLITKFFGGKGSYSDTLAVLVMASASGLIFMAPMCFAYAVFIGYIVSPLSYAIIIYTIYLQYKGIKHTHMLPSKEAAVATVVAVALEVLLFAALYIALYLLTVLFSRGMSA